MVEKYYKREGRRFVQVELPQMSTIMTNNVGKYYQNDGTFAIERNKDSVGLCIISLPTGHVVMALKDCEGEYTHDEAVEEVKNHFNGKGEIPDINEMVEALIKYKKELGLEYYTDYRASLYSIGETGTTVVRCCAYMHFALSSTTFGLDWMDYRMRLRPIVRVK